MSGANALKRLPLLPIFTLKKPINPSGVTFRNLPVTQSTQGQQVQDREAAGGWVQIKKLMWAKPQTFTNRLVFWGETKPESGKAKLFLREARRLIPGVVKQAAATMELAYTNDILFAVSNWLTCASKNEDIRDVLINFLLEDDYASGVLIKTIKHIESDGRIHSIKKAARKFIDHTAPRLPVLRYYLVEVQLAEKYNVRRDVFGYEVVAKLREVVDMLDKMMKGASVAAPQEMSGLGLGTNVISFLTGMVEIEIKEGRKYFQKSMKQLPNKDLIASFVKELFSRFAYADKCEGLTEEELLFLFTAGEGGMDKNAYANLIDDVIKALVYLSQETPYAANALIWFADQGSKPAQMLVSNMPFNVELFHKYVKIAGETFIKHGETGETDAREKEKAIIPIRVIKRFADYGNAAAEDYFVRFEKVLIEGVQSGDPGCIATYKRLRKGGIL